ncbi:MAG TPA: flagellar basal body P-ring formation chaperone FlgA [Steroidobacteraceae bacterium]|nr:flagellar basal body P-ring formation chaperone FlgA [Steroidobacteraceae bacterium]
MRNTSKFRRLPVGRCSISAAALTALAAAASGADWQDLEQLEALAKAEAALHLPPLTPSQRLVAGPLDSHLQLERCRAPVKPLIGAGGHMRDRILVQLRCSGSANWHIYVPVRVVGTSTVTLAAHAIVAGSIVTDKDLRTEQRDVSTLPPGYMDDPAVVVGLTAGRAIASGAVITNQALLAAKAVQRGQTVTLLADSGTMSVRMAGRALTDGLINQRVKVQNLSSGKVVEGIARSEQVVEIVLQ